MYCIMKNITFLILLLFLISCTHTPTPLPNKTIAQVESAHQKTKFLENEAIQFDFLLSFHKKERFHGKVVLLTNSTKGMLCTDDGDTIIYVNNRVFHTPDISKPEKVRFDAFTWPYFFLFPYKLSDPGTNWSSYPNNKLNNTSYIAQKLSFQDGIGDAPEDWYIMYADSNTKRIDVAAYIVTANKSREEAEKNPHAIQYLNYEGINDIPISTQWLFWEWDEKTGLHDTIGEASLRNITFLTVDSNYFSPPKHFEEK